MTNEGLNKIDHEVPNYQNGTIESNSPKTAQSPRVSKIGHLYGDVRPYSASDLWVSERVPPTK